MQKPESPWKQLSRYMEIGMMFPASLVAGLLAGYGLDRLFGTHFFYLVCMFLGIAGAFVRMFKLLNK